MVLTNNNLESYRSPAADVAAQGDLSRYVSRQVGWVFVGPRHPIARGPLLCELFEQILTLFEKRFIPCFVKLFKQNFNNSLKNASSLVDTTCWLRVLDTDFETHTHTHTHEIPN